MGDDRDARLALNCVVEAGDANLAGLLGHYTPDEVWQRVRGGRGDPAWVRRAGEVSLARVEWRAARHALRFVVPGDAEWPVGLEVLGSCEPVQGMTGVPVGLWVAGAHSLGPLVEDSVALVGSRASTAYGDRVASEWAAELAGGGTTVVSGGAYGIDAAAHRGALAEDGPTIAVLANGLDEVYPRSHVSLLGRVREVGLLVSEYPPGEHPTRPRFLARNRLIAALSGATVIVEAAARSGARNTATWANACGRPVGAVPGPVSSAQSFGTHRLIRDGEATLVGSVDQVRGLAGPLGGSYDERPPQLRLLDGLAPAERAVYEALPSRGGRSAGQLAVKAGLAVPVALAALGALESVGMVVQRADGCWRLGPVENRPVLSAQQDDQ